MALGLIAGSMVAVGIGMLLFPGSNLPGGPFLLVPAAPASAIGVATLFGAAVAALVGYVERVRARRRRPD